MSSTSNEAYLWFRETEVGPDDGEGAKAGPEEGGLALPVPGGRVQHAGLDDVDEDAAEVVEVAGQHHRLDAQTRGRDLGHERVTHWADGEVVDEGVHQDQGAGGVAEGAAGGWDGETAD